MNDTEAICIILCVVFVLAVVRYIYKKKSRVCDLCGKVWDGICDECRKKMFPEDDE